MSDHPAIGKHFAVIETSRTGRVSKFSGVVVAVERGGQITNINTGESWPGIRFQLKQANGRKRWTMRIADKEKAQ